MRSDNKTNVATISQALYRVVCVSDDPTPVGSVVDILSPEPNFVARHVPSIEDACQDQTADVAVVDLSTPESKGLEGLAQLREAIREDAIVIAIIGSRDTMLGIEAIRADAQDCVIRENLTSAVLTRTMLHALERHRLRHGMHELIETNPDGMLIVSDQGEVVFANSASQQLLGRTREQLMGEFFGMPLVSGEFAEMQLPGDRHAQMRVVSTQWRTQPARLVSLRDVTKNKLHDKEVWTKANFDSLTKLPNRALFIDRLDNAILSNRRSEAMLGLMFIDLDRLKSINDTFGHGAGDQVLRETARRLQSCVRESDTVGRLGGDEFVILLSQINGPEGTERVAKKVIAEIEKPYVVGDGNAVSVSVSIGIALSPQNARDVYGLINSADTAMYQAKAQGRNGYAFYSSQMHASVASHRSLENDLRAAIDNDDLELHYQPVVNLATGQIDDVEALLRWTHPKRGLLDTESVVEIASHSRLLSDLDDWVLRTGARQAREWKDSLFAAPRIWVNLATDRRLVGGYDEVLDDVLEDVGLTRGENAMGVELTERCCIDESRETHDFLKKIRRQGVKLAIDDFLSSSSSISHLRNLPIDVVKIDRHAIKPITEHEHDRGLVVSLIEMAHRLNLKIVAEGVETDQQLKILRQAGCDAGQGFLFSHAISAEQLHPMLEDPRGLSAVVGN